MLVTTGPSGCGKSTLLRCVMRTARARGVRVVDGASVAAADGDCRPVVDLFGCPVGAALRHLSRAGLGEARLWARTAGELSEGERGRLMIVLAMSRVEGGELVVLDEFCSVLDRVTARSVAGTLRRWVRTSGARVICATAHDDLAGVLQPDITIDPSEHP